jgi:hypothetical protein
MTGVLGENEVGFTQDAQRPERDVFETTNRRRNHGEAT